MDRGQQSQQGAAAVELALLTPLIIALIFGVVEFGLVMHTKNLISEASREGARVGVVFTTPRKTSSEIEAVVRNLLQQSSLASATVTTTGAGGAGGAPLSVRVDYIYQFAVLPREINNFLAGKMGDITLTAETVMRME